MKEQEDPPSVYFDDTFKPPDRSTSAPPVLSLHSESLFAFRAAEHLNLFSDIRCEDNYYEFYKKYQSQNPKLPPPLQTQPYIVERSFVLPEDEPVHPRGYEHHRYPVPSDPRNVVHPGRGPAPFMRPHMYDAYDPSRMVDELPADSPTNEAIWTPLYRKMASLVLDEEEKQDKRPNPMMHQQRHDPYYHNDFDAAYSTANQLLKEDNPSNIQSLWNDRGMMPKGFDSRQQYRNPQSISTPTPIMPSQVSPLLSLLNGKPLGNDPNAMGGYFPEVSSSPIDGIAMPKISPPKRRGSSGDRINLVPPSLTPPLPSNNQSSSPNLPICRYFAQGYCSRGDRCNFMHEADPQQIQQQIQRQPSPQIIAPVARTATPPSIMASITQGLEPTLFNRHNGAKVRKGSTPSPPLPQSAAGLVGLGLGMGPNSQLLDSLAPKKMPAQSRSPAPVRPPPPEVNFGKERDSFGNGGNLSPALPPTPLSPTGLGSPSKGDLTRQYTSIEQVVGHIYSLCKDQHGCRFLQKKLEDREPNVAEYIFAEVYDHMTELMTDPFGNYLCQKLLEHCDDSQRLEVIQRVAGDLVKISKNMHGTRAVQKMIEYLTTPAQIAIVKKALANSVVPLIQDLNGNHVIQRCLNRLSPQDNQFIYDSVSQAGHCVEVATHRHGCCVLQRCIDHASESQKMQLINEVIANALVLVQDPYGNYVVQYVLDLAIPGLASELARRFLGHIPILSTQKFSSNVIEKCLNVADASTRAVVIQELVEYDNLLYLLQDPYANYVIQTSLNVTEPMQHARLVEAIRPHLPALRNTPYGKRIQNKILKESSREYY